MSFKKFLISISLFSFLFLLPKTTKAIDNNQSQKATITNIVEEKEIEVMGVNQLYQKLELELDNSHQKIIIENGNQPLANIVKYDLNDRVILTRDSIDGVEQYSITDFVRTDSLVLLSVVFIFFLIIIAKWKGFLSLIAMIFTFFIVLVLILPKISSGTNPILISIIGSLIIIPISFYLAHGFNKKTTISIISSIITLIITIVLGSIFIKIGHLTGLSSEEAGMLSLNQSTLNMKGILLAGIIIGALGVLDDITIAQSAVVEELSNTGKITKAKDLYSKSMNVGRDHITSMVNTLILAYAGASLPLLLIFFNNPHPFSEIINYEFITEEIIRTLIGSIGLILAVPITTLLAANVYSTSKKQKK